MAESSKVVGEGTYGCVHNPPLNCKGNPQRPTGNKVTKLMKKEEAVNELKEYDVLSNVDPHNEYYLGTPESCKVDNNVYNQQSAVKCRRLKAADPKIIRNLSEYTLLIMENGGDNLEIFSEKILKEGNTPNLAEKIERFWLEAHRLLMGVKRFLDHGIIHHDLKPQNIVYNEETGRINFIDFGLIQRKQTVIDEAADSEYDFDKYHWSYPLEFKFLNLDSYNKNAKFSAKHKFDYLKNVANSLKEGGGTEFSDAVRFFVHFAGNKDEPFLNAEKMTADILKQFGEVLFNYVVPNNYSYKTLVNKCLDTFDSYGLGLGLINVLKNAHTKMNVDLSNDLAKLFLDMTNANFMKRIDIDTAIHRNEDILEKRNILNRFNKHFKNHELVDGSLMPVVLEKIITDASAKIKHISPKEIKELVAKDPEALEPKPVSSYREIIRKERVQKNKRLIIKELEKRKSPSLRASVAKLVSEKKVEYREGNCPEGKEMNPKTRRCVKKCKEGEARNDKFECRKTLRKWRKRKAEKNMIE